MFEPPDHYHNVSLQLSEVLDDIGVNQRLLEKRKRAWFFFEGSQNVRLKLDGTNVHMFYFGSQTEGSTTDGLQSDVDRLSVLYDVRVISDWPEWEPLRDTQWLMIQDQTTSPGYCLLQSVRPDAPLPVQNIEFDHHTTDCRGRLLLSHSIFFSNISGEGVRHGPAISTNTCGILEDKIYSMYCSTWPKEADLWLHQQNSSGWPTADMKRHAAQSGCFLVPVASRYSEYEDTEWRISTTLAERCLMLSLNLTELRCYILMKMITKSLLHPEFEDCVTSFICKTILFHCIANSVDRSLWCDHNLLICLNTCLQRLLHNILTENCPHFIIPGNNLLKGKLIQDMKQQLAEKMCSLTGDIVLALIGIRIDDLGIRLSGKIGQPSYRQLISKDDIHKMSALKSQEVVASSVFVVIHVIFIKLLKDGVGAMHEKLFQIMLKLHEIASFGNVFEHKIYRLSIPFLSTTLGSILASNDIGQGRGMSPESLSWFSAGLDSDIASSRLKLAAALYCTGEFGRCEIVLNDLETRLNSPDLYFICVCIHKFYGEELIEKNEEQFIKENIVSCVKYLPSETCFPPELMYELFRSTGDDFQYIGINDGWMYLVVVDSLSYLYFLQYKVYSQLHKLADQRRALDNLAKTIHTDPELGHKETALNLLGQLYEQENRIQYALDCYTMSLNVRNRNNAAKWHICKLLAAQVRQLNSSRVDGQLHRLGS